MKCCDVKIFGMFHDDETGEDYLLPIKPVCCPLCGSRRVNPDFLDDPSQELWKAGVQP